MGASAAAAVAGAKALWVITGGVCSNSSTPNIITSSLHRIIRKNHGFSLFEDCFVA
jgi:hypothetical protein